MYEIVDIILAVICIANIYQGWRKGAWRMVIEVVLFLAAFVLASLSASWLAAHLDIYSNFLKAADVFSLLNGETCNWILWFVISYLVLRLLFSGILRATPYSKVKGLLSLANHAAGCAISFVLVCCNILILTMFLNTNPIVNMQPFLENSWLRPASNLILEKAAWLESEVRENVAKFER